MCIQWSKWCHYRPVNDTNMCMYVYVHDRPVLCVPGKSASAVQADLQPGGQISRWIWRRGPVPPSQHLGEPLMTASDLLLPFRFRVTSSLVVRPEAGRPTNASSVIWAEPRAVVVGNQFLPCAFLCSLPVLAPSSLCPPASFSPANNQTVANMGHTLWLFLEQLEPFTILNLHICPNSILYDNSLRRPVSCESSGTCLPSFLLFTKPQCPH